VCCVRHERSLNVSLMLILRPYRYGPRQAKNAAYSEKGKLNVEVKFAPFSCAERRDPLRVGRVSLFLLVAGIITFPLKDVEDHSISLLIHQSLLPSLRLELFPKSSIDIFITILENDGLEGCVASGCVAASTALADAGIEMFGLTISCCCAIVGEEVWLDPTREEVESNDTKGTVVVGYMPALGSVTNVWQTGKINVDQAMQVSRFY
jgi:exosome complex component MTR3